MRSRTTEMEGALNWTGDSLKPKPRFYPKPRFCGGDCVRDGEGNGREKPNPKVSKVPMAIKDRDFGLTGQDREAEILPAPISADLRLFLQHPPHTRVLSGAG